MMRTLLPFAALASLSLLAVARLVRSIRDHTATPSTGRHRPFAWRGLGGLRLLTLPVAILLAVAAFVWQSPLTRRRGRA